MIAAEAPTDIVINGSPGAGCGLLIEFGDGTREMRTVSEASPFPVRVTHTYPKLADLVVRVAGAGDGTTPPCEGAVDATIHVSPAGSKIEFITLTTGCPEGWMLKGAVNADKSFLCAPIPDASAPTNLIHCIDGMKYFVKDGHVGCRHPLAALPEPPPVAKGQPAKGKRKPPAKGGEAANTAAGAGNAKGVGAPKAAPATGTTKGSDKGTANSPAAPQK